MQERKCFFNEKFMSEHPIIGNNFKQHSKITSLFNLITFS